MSITKHIWIERDPAYQDVRTAVRAEFDDYAREFVHRLPALRFERGKDGKRRRNPWWPNAVDRAIEGAKAEVIQVNGGIFFRTKSLRDTVKESAELYLAQAHAMLIGDKTQISQADYRAARFAASLKGKHTTVEAEREKARLAHTDCPECGYPMKVRTARKGGNSGWQFMGCRFYPGCKGTKPMPH